MVLGWSAWIQEYQISPPAPKPKGPNQRLKDVKMVRVLVKNFLVSIIHLSIGSFNAPLPGQPTGI